MKKVLGLLSIFVLAFVLVGCMFGGSETSTELTYMSIDINPSAEFIYDENEVIVSYDLLNEAAEIVAGDIDFVGMEVDDAIEEYLDAAVETGFIDVDADDNAVLITVTEEDGSEVEEDAIIDDVCDKVEGYFARNRIRAGIEKNKKINAELKTQAGQLGVSPGKVHLAKRAMECDPELTLEAAATLPVRELLSKVQAEQEAARTEFALEKEAECAMIKTQLRTQLQTRVQQHKALVEGGGQGSTELPPVPDFDAIRTQLREQAQLFEGSYGGRIRDRIDGAREECGLDPLPPVEEAPVEEAPAE